MDQKCSFVPIARHPFVLLLPLIYPFPSHFRLVLFIVGALAPTSPTQ